MSTSFELTLIKLHHRRFITPNQSGRKSPLRREVQIEEIDEIKFSDDCDLEIMAILSGKNNFSDSDDSEDYMDDFIYERSKNPDFFY